MCLCRACTEIASNIFQSFLISPKAELILLVLLPFLCSSWRKQLIYQMPETTLSESGMNQKKIERMSSVKCHKGSFLALHRRTASLPLEKVKSWPLVIAFLNNGNDDPPRYDMTYVFWSRMEGMELPHHLHHQRSSNPCQDGNSQHAGIYQISHGINSNYKAIHS